MTRIRDRFGNDRNFAYDALGTTVGAKKDGKYSAAALMAFGECLDNVDSTSPAIRSLGEGWFTGKPVIFATRELYQRVNL